MVRTHGAQLAQPALADNLSHQQVLRMVAIPKRLYQEDVMLCRRFDHLAALVGGSAQGLFAKDVLPPPPRT